MNSTLDAQDIRVMRKAMRLTQEQLAAALGVRLRTVARWEAGDNAMPETTARLLRLLAKLAEKERA
jgi:DNA-binding transcriptional regulator YiaG